MRIESDLANRLWNHNTHILKTNTYKIGFQLEIETMKVKIIKIESRERRRTIKTVHGIKGNNKSVPPLCIMHLLVFVAQIQLKTNTDHNS